MKKRPSAFVHTSEIRSRHVSIQRQGQSYYNNNNGRSKYNCSDRSYNNSRPDNRSSYQPNNCSSRTTGNHSSCSKHQYWERRYERNRNPNGNANGNSIRSSNYRSSGLNNRSYNRGRSHHDSHHVDDYNERSLSCSRYPGLRSPSPQARKRKNNGDRSNSSDCGRNSRGQTDKKSTSALVIRNF